MLRALQVPSLLLLLLRKFDDYHKNPTPVCAVYARLNKPTLPTSFCHLQLQGPDLFLSAPQETTKKQPKTNNSAMKMLMSLQTSEGQYTAVTGVYFNMLANPVLLQKKLRNYNIFYFRSRATRFIKRFC